MTALSRRWAGRPLMRRTVEMARLALVGLVAALTVMAIASYVQLSQAREPRLGASGGAAAIVDGGGIRDR